MIDPKQKTKKLAEIYAKFEEELKPFAKDAVCRAGCSFCCTHFGNVDIVTLEGLSLLARIRELAPKIRKGLDKKIRRNQKR